jgi:hypothetical protein
MRRTAAIALLSIVALLPVLQLHCAAACSACETAVAAGACLHMSSQMARSPLSLGADHCSGRYDLTAIVQERTTSHISDLISLSAKHVIAVPAAGRLVPGAGILIRLTTRTRALPPPLRV